MGVGAVGAGARVLAGSGRPLPGSGERGTHPPCRGAPGRRGEGALAAAEQPWERRKCEMPAVAPGHARWPAGSRLAPTGPLAPELGSRPCYLETVLKPHRPRTQALLSGRFWAARLFPERSS